MIGAATFGGKRYAVLGLARSGLATAQCLWKSGASVTAWDDDKDAREALSGGATIADPATLNLRDFDAVVVSPGIPLNTHPIAEQAKEADTPIIGDIELFAQLRSELPAHKVVGITGTNGKSTTATLVHHILKTAGVETLLGGNIGVPILGQEPLGEGGVYVLELSSYQIDLTHSLDCDVAALLNITPDHLDRYEDFAAYAASKGRLFQMQSDDHSKIISIDDAPGQAIAAGLSGKVIRFSAGGCLDQSVWPALQGPHNAQNAIAAATIARELGVEQGHIDEALKTFRGLPHRMEIVGDRDGVLFVNDSKATNPTSVAPALASYGAIHWICGGQAKTDDLGPCEPYFENVKAAYAIGEAAEKFERLLEPHMFVKRFFTLREAVELAATTASSGEVVMLSPACASFDQYRNFEERGDEFRGIVRGLL